MAAVPRRPLREGRGLRQYDARRAHAKTHAQLWMQKTVFDILVEQAAKHRTALPSGISAAPSAGALKDRIERAAQFYRSIGITRGDVVTSAPAGSNLPSRSLRSSCWARLRKQGQSDFRARELRLPLKFSGSSAMFSQEWRVFRLRRHGTRPATESRRSSGSSSSAGCRRDA